MSDFGNDRSTKAIGARLRLLRHYWSDELGRTEKDPVTQKEMADLIDVSSSNLANWEQGLTGPSRDAVYKLWTITGATADWMLWGSRAGLPAKLTTWLVAFDKGKSRRA